MAGSKAKIPLLNFHGADQDVILKILENAWQDHIQTRGQTWKALEVTAILAVALIGLDWRMSQHPFVTPIAAGLLLLISLFGTQITLRHRNKVMIEKFSIINEAEKELGLIQEVELPSEIRWWHIFLFWRSSTPLFMLRMHFIIQIFAVVYMIIRILNHGVQNG